MKMVSYDNLLKVQGEIEISEDEELDVEECRRVLNLHGEIIVEEDDHKDKKYNVIFTGVGGSHIRFCFNTDRPDESIKLAYKLIYGLIWSQCNE